MMFCATQWPARNHKTQDLRVSDVVEMKGEARVSDVVVLERFRWKCCDPMGLPSK